MSRAMSDESRMSPPTAHRTPLRLPSTSAIQVEQREMGSFVGGSSSGIWTLDELLVLNNAKKQDWMIQRHGTPLQRSRNSNLRWEAVAGYCRHEGVSRTSTQCRSCWERYHKDWKKINSYENNIPSGHSSYWNMTEAERREKDLPRTFNKRLFDAMQSWLGGREACNPQNILTENLSASTPRSQPVYSFPPGSHCTQSQTNHPENETQSNQPENETQSNQPENETQSNQVSKEDTGDRQSSGRRCKRRRVDALDDVCAAVSSSSQSVATAISESSKFISVSQVEALKQISESEIQASLQVEIQVANILAEAIKSLKK